MTKSIISEKYKECLVCHCKIVPGREKTIYKFDNTTDNLCDNKSCDRIYKEMQGQGFKRALKGHACLISKEKRGRRYAEKLAGIMPDKLNADLAESKKIDTAKEQQKHLDLLNPSNWR